MEDSFTNQLDKLKALIEKAEGKEMSVKETHEERVERESFLDPLHVMTPIKNDLQMTFPTLNLSAGSTNWAIVATAANLIIALRTKNLSSPEIEYEIKCSVTKMYTGLYASSKVFKK
jgi:hypothetical protein